MGTGGHFTRIVAGDRCVVDDIDLQRCVRTVAIGVDDGHDEGAVKATADHVVAQRVAEADLAIRQVDAGDGERTHRAFEGLTDFGDGHAVDENGSDAVRRVENDGAGRGFAVRCLARTFRFGDAVDRACGQAVFIDGGDGVDDTDRIVRRFDHDDGVFLDIVGDDLALFGLRELQLGVGQQVADRISCLDVARIDFEIAARALRVASGRLRFVTGEQGGEVGGRDGNAIDDDLRHDDRAFGNDDTRAVFHHDDEIAALNTQVVERDAGGEFDHAVRIGLKDDIAAARCAGRRVIGLRVGSLVFAVIRASEVVARFEAVHVIRPCSAGWKEDPSGADSGRMRSRSDRPWVSPAARQKAVA